LTDCVPIRREVGESCEGLWQCQIEGQIECAEYSWKRGSGEKVCKCKNDYVNEPGKNECYKTATAVHDRCEIHAQCVPKLKHSRCINGLCRCIDGAEKDYRYGYSGYECVLKSKP